MRVTVRLASETMSTMRVLKSFLETDSKFLDLNVTNGTVVNQAFEDIKNVHDWKEIIDFKNDLPAYYEKPVKTNLNLNDYSISEIDRLKKELLDFLTVNYVTTPYVIRLVLKASLLIRQNKIVEK